jgi:DNA polymerase III epsilon subunit-like protein
MTSRRSRRCPTVNSRIVSIALNEIVNGRVFGGYSRLVDPGAPVIGSGHIHGITVELLHAANAPMFMTVTPDILERLTSHHGETVALVGFNVVFDALMLHNELVRVGLSLNNYPCSRLVTLTQEQVSRE